MSDFNLKINEDSKMGNNNLKIAIVVSKWNSTITSSLYNETKKTLQTFGVNESNIFKNEVPGSFELIYAAKKIGINQDVDAIIAIGCIIKGETPHFDYISQNVTSGIKDLNISLNKPVIFGVLTTNNLDEAIKRSSGEKNKGKEFAISAIEMTKI
ncbi:MAG: 6,7-dimethyl-8-ribityllumazine synthase [Flavobacteriales bacterium]|mgnify:FL=1|nr:6,7-dimethyl-8-ribityllumazine synthase [Flavobacteriales bacterium]|tara:strand:+ start:20985 stop:21449 length:465 start_codon:yes stop_codon:yes gene_type:complete